MPAYPSNAGPAACVRFRQPPVSSCTGCAPGSAVRCQLIAIAEVQIEARGWHHRMEVVILGIGPPCLPIRSVVRTLSSQKLSPTHLRWYLEQDQQVEHIVEFGSSTVRTLEYHHWRYHRPDRRAAAAGHASESSRRPPSRTRATGLLRPNAGWTEADADDANRSPDPPARPANASPMSQHSHRRRLTPSITVTVGSFEPGTDNAPTTAALMVDLPAPLRPSIATKDRRTDDKIATEKNATETLDQGPGDLRRRPETPRDIPVTASNHADHHGPSSPARPPGHPLIPTSQAFPRAHERPPPSGTGRAARSAALVQLSDGNLSPRLRPVSKSRQALRLGRHLPAVPCTLSRPLYYRPLRAALDAVVGVALARAHPLRGSR